MKFLVDKHVKYAVLWTYVTNDPNGWNVLRKIIANDKAIRIEKQ